MEFKFNCEEALCCDKDGYGIIDALTINDIKHSYLFTIKEIIDSLGINSSKVFISLK